MSEYEGKWLKCLHPEPYKTLKTCNFMGWHGTESICLADPDEGCLEHKERSKEHCDSSKEYYEARNKLAEKPPELIEIELPKTIKIGGFDYEVICSKERDEELDRHNLYGIAYHNDTRREINVKTTMSPQNLSNTIIHELVHTADTVNNSCSRLTEAQVEGVANGLHQIFEQLNIRFVVKQ